MAVVTGSNTVTVLDLAGSATVTADFTYDTNGEPEFTVTKVASAPPIPPNFHDDDPITFTITITKKPGVLLPISLTSLIDTLPYPLVHNEFLNPVTIVGSTTVPVVVYVPGLLTITLLTLAAAEGSTITVTIPCTVQL